MSKPIVYGPRFSTYTRSVLLALEEKGIDHDVQEINIFEGENQTPEYLARQPFAKVPAFSHDGLDLYETSAILRYVDEAFGGVDLQPSDARGRGKMQQVLAVVDSYAYPAFITNIVIPRVVVPMLGGETDETAVAAAVPAAEKSVAALEALIGTATCFAGNAVSLADLHFVPVYDYFRQTPEGEAALKNASGLKAWWSGIKDRASVVKTTPEL